MPCPCPFPSRAADMASQREYRSEAHTAAVATVLRLRDEGLSFTLIAERTGLSRRTVATYISEAREVSSLEAA